MSFDSTLPNFRNFVCGECSGISYCSSEHINAEDWVLRAMVETDSCPYSKHRSANWKKATYQNTSLTKEKK